MGIFAAAPSCGSATVARAIKDVSRFGFLAVSRRKIEFIGLKASDATNLLLAVMAGGASTRAAESVAVRTASL